MIENDSDDQKIATKNENAEKIETEPDELDRRSESVVYRNPQAASSPSQYNLIVPHALFQVIQSFI